jgi:hypothetical protein
MPHNKELADILKAQGIGFSRCLEPTMQCTQQAIRAHSIQNRQTITLLEKDNHVIAWQPRRSKNGHNIDFNIEFRRIGRSKASVFCGFCNQHDADIFRPLDTKPLDITDREQLFLLAYRCITYELHAIMTNVAQLQSLYGMRVERGADLPDSSSPAGQKAVEQMLLCWATWRYRCKYYDEPILSQLFGNIEHHVIELDNQPPCLAVSSFFTLKDGLVDADLVGTALNILPVSEEKTVVIFSYASHDRGIVRATLDRILYSCGYVQKYELSKLILSRAGNVLISPHHFDKWNDTKKNKIKESFIEAIQSNRDVDDNMALMLF